MMDMSLFWTVIGSASGVIGFNYMFLRNFKSDMKDQITKLDQKIDKLDDKLMHVNERCNDIDKRLYGMETVLHMKDCCVLKQDQNLKRAE